MVLSKGPSIHIAFILCLTAANPVFYFCKNTLLLCDALKLTHNFMAIIYDCTLRMKEKMDFGLNHIKMVMFYVLLIDPLPRRPKNWIHINSIEISI